MLKMYTDSRDQPCSSFSKTQPCLDLPTAKPSLNESLRCDPINCNQSQSMKTENEPPPLEPLGKEKARRSRKDEQGRNYSCGCGKKYLSYPALYTHIRNKHSGKTPEGTKNSTMTINKRGRPKRETHDEADKHFESLLQLSDLTILNHLDQNYEGNFELASQYKEIFEGDLLKFYKMLKNGEHEDRLETTMPFGLVIVHFCIGLSRIVDCTMFYHFSTFLKVVYRCFQQHITEIWNNCFTQSDPNMTNLRDRLLSNELSKEELLYSSCLIPLMGDFLFRAYVPQKSSSLNIPLCMLMFYDFCRWLHKTKLTLVEINFKNKDEIVK